LPLGRATRHFCFDDARADGIRAQPPCSGVQEDAHVFGALQVRTVTAPKCTGGPQRSSRFDTTSGPSKPAIISVCRARKCLLDVKQYSPRRRARWARSVVWIEIGFRQRPSLCGTTRGARIDVIERHARPPRRGVPPNSRRGFSSSGSWLSGADVAAVQVESVERLGFAATFQKNNAHRRGAEFAGDGDSGRAAPMMQRSHSIVDS